MKPSFFKKTTNSITNTKDAVVNQLQEGLSKIGDFGKNNTDKFLNYVKEIFDMLPTVERAGFKAQSVAIGISLPPSVDISFIKIKEVSQSEIDALYETHKNNKTFKLILSSLLTAARFQKRLAPEHFEFMGIELSVTFPPRVSIRYANKELIGEHFFTDLD